jgi:2'-5' RNA ligase
MMIEHSNNLHVALLFTGYDSEDLRKDLQELMSKIEKSHKKTLEDWDGTVEVFAPVKKLVTDFCEKGGAPAA